LKIRLNKLKSTDNRGLSLKKGKKKEMLFFIKNKTLITIISTIFPPGLIIWLIIASFFEIDNKISITDIVALVLSVLTIIITFKIYLEQRNDNDNIRFTGSYNKIYKEIFSMRKDVTNILKISKQYEFYYELDTIKSHIEIEEKVLDHLTRIENFFTLVGNNKKVTKTFEKLTSYAFYQRIIAFYPYILYVRKNNENMFTQIVEVINLMEKMQKIKSRIQLEKNKCYIGIRESDILYTSNYFKKSVCIFSQNVRKDDFSVRPNQNIPNKETILYYNKGLDTIKSKGNKYVFYNQNEAYNFPPHILAQTICLNKLELLSFLNNKLSVKEWLAQNNVPIIPYETFLGKDILLSKLSDSFSKAEEFVVQSYHGGGGIGTFLFNHSTSYNVRRQINMLQQYIVSPYIPSISANTHIFISDKQIILSPASIQIIELHNNQLCYRGCDYIAFRTLPNSIKEKIKDESLSVAQLLLEKGYRGIAGIDFIIDKEDNVYVSEINPRFQASTILLDKYLSKNKKTPEAKSTLEINEMAFLGGMISTLCFTDEINLSCYYYYKDEFDVKEYKNKFEIFERNNCEILADGVIEDMNLNKIGDNSYLYRVVFPHAICAISPDKDLWIHNNIQIGPKPKDTISLKIALLNQGVRLDSTFQNVKNGVYNSIDIKLLENSIYDSININCAYNIHHSNYSPFYIKNQNGIAKLFYNYDNLCDVLIETNSLEQFTETEREILYLATDRLRINIISGCENKNIGQGCKFCNVSISNKTFTYKQIIDALEHLKTTQKTFEHIMLGGGSRLDAGGWKLIIQICNYLKNDEYYRNKPLSLMSMLPSEAILNKLKEAGIEEVAFNIEVANERLAKCLMPAKHKEGKEAYYNILNKSVNIFGEGNVRSALIVGLDQKEELYNEILTLADMNVIPCLSALRILPGSSMENALPPSNEYLIDVYNHSCALLKELGGSIKDLGPKCNSCRNNMLHL